jgi:hypothetical protein
MVVRSFLSLAQISLLTSAVHIAPIKGLLTSVAAIYRDIAFAYRPIRSKGRVHIHPVVRMSSDGNK